VCYYCKKYRHYARECRKRQRDYGKSNAHYTVEGENQGEPKEHMFMSFNATIENEEDTCNLDFGCSNHMNGKSAKEEAWDGSVQTTIEVVEIEQSDEEDDPIHTPIE